MSKPVTLDSYYRRETDSSGTYFNSLILHISGVIQLPIHSCQIPFEMVSNPLAWDWQV